MSVTRFSTVLMWAAFACGNDGIGPSNLSVSSAPDLFLLQVFDLEADTDVLSYNWVVTGSQAVLNATNGVSAGTVVVTIRDADGNSVHEGDLATINGVDTSVGTAGTWVISVNLTGATGSFTLGARLKT